MHLHTNDRPNIEDRDYVEITLKVSNTDFVKPLIRFLQIVKDVADGGHSFDIEADRDQSGEYKDGHPKIGIDGDGADKIYEILVDGKKPKDVRRKEYHK